MKNLNMMLLVAMSVAVPPSFGASSGADANTNSSTTAFGMRLFREIAKSNPNRNVLISPVSISLAMNMAYNGAAGGTKTAMAKVLGFGKHTLEEVNTDSMGVMNSLRYPGGTTKLEIANALFGSNRLTFKQPFLAANKKFYDAEVQSLDFKSPEAAIKMNTWVSRKTHGLIPEIIASTNPSDTMYLINAVYFNGRWRDTFDKALTKPKPFHLANRTTKMVPMMKMSSTFDYCVTPDFQAIALPYTDGRMSLFVFLPSKKQSLTTFEKKLTTDNWRQWEREFSKEIGEVQLPRFKVSADAKLKKPLSVMGLELPFTPSAADFSGVAQSSQGPINISDVLHKTYMDVNEEGTEAGAASAVSLVLGGEREPKPPFKFIADRPFFIALHDRITERFLFLGHVVAP
jgi:serine protease inhibitor